MEKKSSPAAVAVVVDASAELTDQEGRSIGSVTSGSFGPSVGAPVAMAYVESAFAAVGTEVLAMVRGKPVQMTVTKLPFVPQRYYRG